MFKNQSYKQKLSFTKNDDDEHVVNVNIVLSTNHELDKKILPDIEEVISGMFLANYTETEELVKEKKEEALRLIEQKRQVKEQAKREREMIKNNEKMVREQEKQQKEYEKNQSKSRSWGNKRREN
jgi:hypothetical protein